MVAEGAVEAYRYSSAVASISHTRADLAGAEIAFKAP
jgi:hypothetical protein